ncbi:MAG: DNA/RNA nuclease SfsA [Clostridiales bacterium]|nr:DNA/RNA nuclease SfsA [Clostridiales bacterium]
MRYAQTLEAVFLERPNRFIARVLLPGGQTETVHVKNTGRCRELLVPGCRVILAKGENPARKTAYDLVAAYKQGTGLINMDSQAPNAAMKEWLEGRDYDTVRAEVAFGNSRMDFYMEKGGAKTLCEVKGCTLEKDGTGYFPDAPTERGAKHLRELAAATRAGYEAVIAFVIQIPGVERVLPNTRTDPVFSQALADAARAGVKIWYMLCDVDEDGMVIREKRECRETGV